MDVGSWVAMCVGIAGVVVGLAGLPSSARVRRVLIAGGVGLVVLAVAIAVVTVATRESSPIVASTRSPSTVATSDSCATQPDIVRYPEDTKIAPGLYDRTANGHITVIIPHCYDSVWIRSWSENATYNGER